MHHPYFEQGEDAETVVQNLGAYIRHVHVKDSHSGRYCLIGEGELPIREMMNGLASINYDGFLSLEWDPEWMAELTEMEVIFPIFRFI